MGFYGRYVLPRLLDLAMRSGTATPYRARLLPAARGRVLEVGIGSGRNLPFYGPEVRSVVGVDPSAELLAMAARRAAAGRFPVELVNRSAEALSFEEGAFDTVVATFTLCSIAEPARALAEIRRVLKPDGALLFVEHGRAPEPGVAAWQDRLNPLWGRIAGGCNLNRRIDDLIRGAGFALDRLDTGYAKGPRPFTFIYEGLARRA